MKNGFRQSMAWLHTWVGLVVGWMLFAIFVMGSASYYRAPITEWMQPERLLAAQAAPSPGAVDADTQTRLAQRAVLQLQRVGPTASRWLVDFPDSRGNAGRIGWEHDGTFSTAPLETREGVAAAGANAPRATAGGQFFYEFHFQLHYLPWYIGRWIVGFCAMCMLVALISGIVTHRRIFTDLFTFRPGKGQRSWLDAHNVAAVLALPYHLMITYTGLTTIMLMLMPWGMHARYPGPEGQTRFIADAYDFQATRAPAGIPAHLTAIAPLARAAIDEFDGSSLRQIWIDRPNDAAARMKFMRGADDRLSNATQSLTFDGITGTRLSRVGPHGAASMTAGVMSGIHQGEFAHPALRACFFLSGLAGAAMVATGLLMWAVKYRQKQTRTGRVRFGTHLVEHLNIATIAGLPIAIAVYFWANRLLPAGLSTRADWEVRAFFLAWLLAALHPLLPSRRVRHRAWIEQWCAGALLFGVLPLLDRLSIGAWVMPWFDAVCLALALPCALIARRLRRPPAGRPTRRYKGPADPADLADPAR
ncbi:PepSY-associated TM helix domain-containing protein [Robbsia sp. Bb-Pol-6]|uniref:PepSY-associated TM helix domain-containing protein n=1 Tax=Robbsia betulipollinis TaxID=2981849 RepID=A0ABT3ZHQ3_9BURK|nr:PepSY-associated TM helix domain-containing protein [Robbsia betulipollinis]MCY0386048.1 PepSY-associated TM helix domain-containing protein [Robbsia betulipollinis]